MHGCDRAVPPTQRVSEARYVPTGTQQLLCPRTPVHLRMKSQGLRELFFGLLRTLLDTPGCHFRGTAIALHPEGRAYGLCLLPALEAERQRVASETSAAGREAVDHDRRVSARGPCWESAKAE